MLRLSMPNGDQSTWRQQIALHHRQCPGQRALIDIDLVAAGARLGDRFDGDIVVAEKLHVDAGKQSCRRPPESIPPRAVACPR